jgi:ArsR family transcriptional regulator
MPIHPRDYKNAAYSHLAQMGKALGNPVRVEILDLLSQAPRTVEVLAGEIGQSVANTSQHLQKLRNAHLVQRERKGLHIAYTIADRDVAGLIAQLHAVGAHHMADLERLTRQTFAERDNLEAVDSSTLAERIEQDNAFLLDVRPAREYAEGHLPGAVSIPFPELEARIQELPKDRLIIAYCRGPICVLAADAAQKLRDLGFNAQRTESSVMNAPKLQGRTP